MWWKYLLTAVCVAPPAFFIGFVFGAVFMRNKFEDEDEERAAASAAVAPEPSERTDH